VLAADVSDFQNDRETDSLYMDLSEKPSVLEYWFPLPNRSWDFRRNFCTMLKQ